LDASANILDFNHYIKASGGCTTKPISLIEDYNGNPTTTWASVDLSIPSEGVSSVLVQVAGYFYVGNGEMEFATEEGSNTVFKWYEANDLNTGSKSSDSFRFTPTDGVKLWFREVATQIDTLQIKVIEYTDERMAGL